MNSITQPFHVKFFGGQDYPDRGYGDKALQSAGEVAGYGRQLLGKNGGLPDLSQMGALGYIPSLAGQQASNLGMQNPFAPQDSVMANDPYKLGAPQQMQLNNQESLIQRAAANARNTARSKLASSGLLNSTTAAAIENAVNEHAGGEAQTAASNAANQQFAMRQGQLSDWQNMMANLYKSQLGQEQAGAQMVAGQIPVQQQVGQQAQANNAATSNFWQSLLGGVLGGANIGGWQPFPGPGGVNGGTPPFAGYSPGIQRQINGAVNQNTAEQFAYMPPVMGF